MKRKKHKKIKEMVWDEFRNVMSLNWEPIELTGNAIPDFLNNLVKSKHCRIYASGTTGIESNNYNLEYNAYYVGGVRLYRDSSNESEGYKWNSDEYLIFSDDDSGHKLMVNGPFKSKIDHWTNSISSSFKNVEIQYFRYPNCPSCGARLDLVNNSCNQCGWKK